MPIQDMKDQVSFEMTTSVKEVFDYCKKREQVRINRENGCSDWLQGIDLTDIERDVLQNSRMNNIFRDHDKTTVCLWSKLDGLSDYEFWRNILIGRFINRIDRIDDAFPLSNDWFDKAGWGDKTPLVNSAAYQLNPGLGKAFGVRRVRECVPLLDVKVEPTYQALLASKTIKEATENVNKAFGGYITFMAFQAALDVATLRPHLLDPTSEIIEGQGAHATLNALGMTVDEIRTAADIYWPEHRTVRPNGLYLFDIENIMCEYRKFMKRQIDGIPSNRRYKQKLC